MQWVEVLNQAVSWSDLDTASRRTTDTGALRAADHAHLVSDAALLRRVFAASYLRLALAEADRQDLLQWLASVTPSLLFDGEHGDRSVTLSGQRRREPLVAPFEAELTGALLQFLATVSEPALFASVHRCQGIRREAAIPLLPEDVELLFAAHAGLRSLVASGVAEPVWSQCSTLIYSQRGRRFCSKACSNANFAARKALQDPKYFAEKQERYRSRQRQSEDVIRRETEGAFVYID